MFQWTRQMNLAPDIDSQEFKQLYWFGSGMLTDDETGTVALCMDLFNMLYGSLNKDDTYQTVL